MRLTILWNWCFVNENIFMPSGKLNKAESRFSSCFFSLLISEGSLSCMLLNFTIAWLFFSPLWQAWMSCWPISMTIFWNTLSTLSSSASSLTEVSIPNSSRHSLSLFKIACVMSSSHYDRYVTIKLKLCMLLTRQFD